MRASGDQLGRISRPSPGLLVVLHKPTAPGGLLDLNRMLACRRCILLIGSDFDVRFLSTCQAYAMTMTCEY